MTQQNGLDINNQEQNKEKLTHFNEAGEAHMVDVHAKDDTYRVAKACGTIKVNDAVYRAVSTGTAKKGDVLGVARIAGIMGTAMIIYYKQISEGYEDQNRFEIMQKVGLSHRDVRSSIRRQILMVFFLPLIMAMLHISMAFPLIRRMLLLFGMTNTKLFIGCTAGTVLIFALVYGLIYIMTAKSYYHIVERK